MNKDNKIAEKILIVTKSIPLQQELQKVLDSYFLLFVDSAEQAIEKISSSKDISALLVGIYLEETKGIELLNYIKKHKDFYTGPVLVITDSISDKVINSMKNYNIFDYIVRYSNDNIIKTRIRNAVIYYSEKRKLLSYAVEQVYQNLNDMKMLISLLAQIVEFKSFECGKHIEQTGIITRILCKKLMDLFPDKYNLSERDIEYITLASALHDIGKVYIPTHILNKPAKLNEEEMNIMRMHTTLGAEILDRMYQFRDRPVMRYARDICLYHHERFDGSGYPKGLKEGEIPIWAQIVSVADCYDALTNDRPYRSAMCHGGALSMIEQGGCGQFNPDLLECLWDCSDQIEDAKTHGISLKITKDSIYNIIEDICQIK